MEIKSQIFKAYDIRGKYPEEINEKAVEIIVKSLIKKLKPKKIVIGHAARLSSPELYRGAIRQLKTKSADRRIKLKTILTGMITTPMLYFLVNQLKADLGIMITASHNPKEYNGLKFVGKNAEPISGKEVYKILISN